MRRTCNYRAFNFSFFFTASRFILLCTFVVFGFTGDALTAEKAFLVASMFNTVRLSMTLFFPFAISQIGEARVSINRIQVKYLFSTDVMGHNLVICQYGVLRMMYVLKYFLSNSGFPAAPRERRPGERPLTAEERRDAGGFPSHRQPPEYHREVERPGGGGDPAERQPQDLPREAPRHHRLGGGREELRDPGSPRGVPLF